MGEESKRMMHPKQEQYREYVIEKLLSKTTIEISYQATNMEEGPMVVRKVIKIHTPFRKFILFLPINEEYDSQRCFWNKVSYHGVAAQGFPQLMNEYGITKRYEVSKVWLQYKGILDQMIGVEVKN